MKEQEGEDGGKDRLQGKNQTDLFRRGVLLGNGLYHEPVGTAHQPQANDGAPFHRSGGQGGSLEQAHSHGAQGGGYAQLDDADEEGVLLFGDLVQHDDVDGVK